MAIQISPNDQPDQIVSKFLQAQDEVRIPFEPEPYDIDPYIITIANKNKPLTIIRLDRDGQKVNKIQPSDMPVILGTAASLLESAPSDCGVFNIGPGCS